MLQACVGPGQRAARSMRDAQSTSCPTYTAWRVRHMRLQDLGCISTAVVLMWLFGVRLLHTTCRVGPNVVDIPHAPSCGMAGFPAARDLVAAVARGTGAAAGATTAAADSALSAAATVAAPTAEVPSATPPTGMLTQQCSSRPWPVIWQLTCGQQLSPSHDPAAAGSRASLARHALDKCLACMFQVLGGPMMAGVLLSAPVISVYTAGLLSYLLLLLTMRPPALAADQQQHVEARRQGGARRRHARPAWASPSTWLQRWPGVRDALVMCYRLVIPAATWVSVGPLAGRGTLPLALSGVGSWRHTHYLFRGWHGCVQPLPLRLQALTCLGEWVLLVATMAALEPGLVPPSSPAATTQALLHLISSWGAVVVVPMVVAAYWERCLVTRYTTYCRGLAATAAATQHQQPSPRKAKRSSTRSTGSFGGARISTSLDMSSGSPASSSTRSTGSDGGALPQPAPCAAVDHSSHAPCQAVPEQQRGAVQQGLISSPSPQQQVVVGGACMQEVAPSSVQGSRPAAKVFTPATCITAASDAALKAAPAAPAAGAGGDAVVAASGMPAALRHQVALLLGQALADELAAAAASCVDYTRVGYVPRSEVVTVSVKVHTSHSKVQQLSPTLVAALHTTLGQEEAGGAGAAPPLPSRPHQMLRAACFQGCVQLLASVYRSRPGRALAAAGMAQRLLAEVQASLLEEEGEVPVEAAIGAGQSTAATWSGNMAGQQRDMGAGEVGQVSVVWQDPPVLLAGCQQDQEVVLVLSNPGPGPCPAAALNESAGASSSSSSLEQSGSSSAAPSAHAGGMRCRLVVYRPGDVLVDMEVEVGQAIRVPVPPVAAGVYHLALLPLAPTPGADTTTTGNASAGPQLPAASAAPLLHHHMVALPLAAWMEVAGLWNAMVQALAAAPTPQLAAAAPPATADGSMVASTLQSAPWQAGPGVAEVEGGPQAAAWTNSFGGLVQDMAFLLAWTEAGAEPGVVTGQVVAGSSARGSIEEPCTEVECLATLQELLAPLLHFFTMHHMWATAEALTQRAMASYSTTRAAAAAAAAAAVRTTGVPAPLQVDAGTGAAPSAPAGDSDGESVVPPASSSSDSSSSSSSSSAGGLGPLSREPSSRTSQQSVRRRKHTPVAAPPSPVKPSTHRDSSRRRSFLAAGSARLAALGQAAVGRELWGGFTDPALAAAYQRHVFVSTWWADAAWGGLEAVFLLASGLLAGLGGDLGTKGVAGALAAHGPALVLVAGHVLPWLALMVLRPLLAQGHRRDAAMAAVVVVRGVLMVGWDARRRLLGCLVDGRRAARHVSLLMVYMGVLCPLQRQAGPAAVLGSLLAEATAHITWMQLHTTYPLAPLLAAYSAALVVAAAVQAAVGRYRRGQFLRALLAMEVPAAAAEVQRGPTAARVGAGVTKPAAVAVGVADS